MYLKNRFQIVCLLFLLCIFIFSYKKNALADPFHQEYPFKTAVVEYLVTSSKGQGRLYLYIKGEKKLERTDHSLTIITPENITLIDLEKRTAVESKNPQNILQEKINKLKKKDQELIKSKMLFVPVIMSLDVNCNEIEQSQGTVLDKPVKIMKTPKGTSHLWLENIPLKTELPGSIVIEAISVKINEEILDSMFTIPPGIKKIINEDQENIANSLADKVLLALEGSKLSLSKSNAEEDLGLTIDMPAKDDGVNIQESKTKKLSKKKSDTKKSKKKKSSSKKKAKNKEEQAKKKEVNSKEIEVAKEESVSKKSQSSKKNKKSKSSSKSNKKSNKKSSKKTGSKSSKPDSTKKQNSG